MRPEALSSHESRRKSAVAGGGALQGRIEVMTLNLRFGLADDGPDDWQHRKVAVRRLLGRHRPDFAAFQEANAFQVDFLAEVLPEYDRIGQRQPAPPFWQNNVLFFHRRWRNATRDHFYLSPTPDIPSRSRDSRWPRQCTLGLFEHADRRLIVVNTHFDFETAVQVESARIILERLSRLPDDVPVILMGDFNAAPDSDCHAVLTDPPRKSGQRRFDSVFSFPFPGTFHGFDGNRDGPHIDWILYRGDLEPCAARVIHRRFGGRLVSDHFPVAASFVWKSD